MSNFMAKAGPVGGTRVLDPVERVSEVVFGLLMALAITGSLSVASAGREEVRSMMFAALGCNIAWGLVDGIMYLVQTLTERTRTRSLLAQLRATTDPAAARSLIAAELPGRLGKEPSPKVLEALREELLAQAPPTVPRLGGDDYLGALGVFLLVMGSTFPVVIPFALIDTLPLAMRASNAVALVMLFAGGWILARYAGGSPWRGGLALAAVGAALTAAIMALGG
jgi:VIT1/CCC1 family predicted Fe2+/Mn2+ transporter